MLQFTSMSVEKDLLEKKIRKLYKEIAANWQTNFLREPIEHLRTHFLHIDPDNFQIDNTFLNLIFLDPSLTLAFHLASARTIDMFRKTLKEGSPSLVKESGFFIAHKQGIGLISTMVVDKPAAFDLPTPSVKTVEDDTRLSIVGVHTHPPLRDVLAPSVLVETDQGYKGDLYSFLAMRKMDQEDIQKGKPANFIQRPLMIILKDNLKTENTEILFIRETKQLALLEEPTYIQMLQENVKLFKEASATTAVCRHLTRMGFVSSFISTPITQYYRYPNFAPWEIRAVAADLKE